MFVPRQIAKVPIIFDDEIFSSLLLRLAARHHLSPHSLCHTVWPRYEFWTRDIDRCARPELLTEVARKTGLSEQLLTNMTLRPLMMSMTGQIVKHGISRWILPVGVYHRHRTAYGLRYCSECLRQDQPHCKRAWRLAFNVACPIHGTLLRDACPHCDMPFLPHRGESLMRRKCFACGGSLLDSSNLECQCGALLFQQSMQQKCACLLDTGHEHFDNWHRLLSLFARKDEHFSNDAGGWFQWRQAARTRLFDFAYEIYSDWPDSFVRWASDHRISQIGLAEFAPYYGWLKEAATLLPERYSPLRRRRRKSISISQRFRRKPAGAEKLQARAKYLLSIAVATAGVGIASNKQSNL